MLTSPSLLNHHDQQALPELSKTYFDIQPPRGQGGNFMQDMLGSLMGGGQQGGGGNKDAAPMPVRHAPPPALPPKQDVAAAEHGEGGTGGSAPGTDGEGLDLD